MMSRATAAAGYIYVFLGSMMEEAFKINQKNKKNRNDTAVQGTNDSAVLSKISMAQLGYFNDDYLKYFGIKAVRRSPIINRGYWIRAKTVDFVLKSFLNRHNNSQTKNQILNLGAGFDSTFFRLKNAATADKNSLLDNTLFIEIDFPDVISRKISLIQSNQVLSDICHDLELLNTTNGNFIYKSARAQYALIGIDMRDTQLLEAMLKLLDEFNESTPTMVLSEVVLTYMAVNSCNNVIKWIPESLQNCLMVVYEQILPETAFGQVMCAHFKKLGSPLRCILRYPTPDCQTKRYREAGFTDSRSMRIIDFFKQRIDIEEKLRVDQIELFDEYEQWHLKCGHYALILAARGSMIELMNIIIPEPSGHSVMAAAIPAPKLSLTEFPLKFGVRFGHSVCVNDTVDKLYVFGGFGESLCEAGRHRRLNTIETVDLKAMTVQSTKSAESDRLFSTSCVLNEKILILFGRSSPNKTYESTYLVEHGEETVEFIPEPYLIDKDTPTQLLRWRHASCRLNNQQVFISGGKTYNQNTAQIETLSDCLVLTDGKWSKINIDENSKFSQQRHSHSMCAWNDYVIITGGLSDNEDIHEGILLLDTRTHEVKELVMNEGRVLPRYSHTSHVINDKLILLGGVGFQSQQPGICIIDLNKLKAVELDFPTNLPDGSPIMLHNHQSVVLNSDTILLVGGGGNCFSFGTHINKKPMLMNIKNVLDEYF